MAAKKGGLGKGLDAIFMENATENSNSTVTLKISELEPNQDQPRREFDDEALAELADSIAQHGVLQPLLVRPIAGGGYQIVAGAKRVVAEGICSADIPPRETATVRVPLDGVKPGKYRIKVTVSRCDEPDLAPQGEILAEAFVPLIVPKASKQ